MISDLFLKLLEKLFELLKLARDKELDHAGPLIDSIFLDMHEIHKAYLDNLTQAKQYIRGAEIDRVIEFLEIERTEIRPLRTAIQALFSRLALNERLRDHQRLLNAMENYINPNFSRSAMFGIFNVLSSVKAKQSSPGNNFTKQVPDLIKDIEYVITELVSSWENISQEYNKVEGTGYSVKT
jgi:hypothetical protein